MQHDVHVYPGPRTRPTVPFIAELQTDVADGRQRIVAPLVPARFFAGAAGRQIPLVHHDGEAYHLIIPSMVLVPRSRLANPVGTIRAYRDEIVRAIDWLFTGI
jgi:toxin CcdB